MRLLAPVNSGACSAIVPCADQISCKGVVFPGDVRQEFLFDGKDHLSNS